MRIPKFEVYPSGSEWRWRLRATNGEIVASGEGYATKQGARRGAQALRRIAVRAVLVELPADDTRSFCSLIV